LKPEKIKAFSQSVWAHGFPALEKVFVYTETISTKQQILWKPDMDGLLN
jgi:hypothetical protein